MDFDDALNLVGSYGRFQKFLVYVFSPLVMGLGALSYWSQIFILLVPDHRCNLPQVLNTTEQYLSTKCGLQLIDQEMVLSTSSLTQSPNFHDVSNYYNARLPARGFPYSSIFEDQVSTNYSTKLGAISQCPSGWQYDYEVIFQTAASQSDWVCGDSWRVSFAHSAYWFGSMFGYFLAGIFLDRFGRWKSTLGFSLCLGLSQILTVFAPEYITFCITRILSGMAAMPMQSSTYTLMVEFISPKDRRIVGASTAICWLVVAAVFPWIAYLIGDWKIICILTACPVLIVVLLMRWLPESPSWLMGRGESRKALETLKYVAKLNKIELSEDDNFKLGLWSKGFENSNAKPLSLAKSTFLLIKSPNIRKKTMTLFICWIFICMSYHGVNLSQSSSGSQIYLIYSLGSLLEIPVCFGHLLLVDKVGRKLLIIAPLVIVAVLGLATSFVKTDSLWVGFGITIATRGLFSLAYNVFFQLSSELFPTTLRGRGVCLMRMLGDVGTTIVPHVINLGSSNAIIPVLFFSVLAVLASVLTLVLPETLHQPLPQTVEDAERFGKEQTLCFWPAFRTNTKISKKVVHEKEKIGNIEVVLHL